MAINLLAQQNSSLAQMLDDLPVGVEDVFPRPNRDTNFLGKASMIVNGRQNRQSILNSGDVVIRSVPGRDVDLPGAGVEGHEIGQDDA